MSTKNVEVAVIDLLSLLGPKSTEFIDKKNLKEVKRKYNEEDEKIYLNLIDYWTRASSAVFGYLKSFSLIKPEEKGVYFDKEHATHAYLIIGDEKHSLHSLNRRTNSDCVPVSIMVLFLVTKTKLDVETIQRFLEEHQNYLGELLESTRFFLYLVGSLDEDQSVEILFNLMFFLKGEHQTESKADKKTESKLSYNERVVSVSPKETNKNNSEWSCTVCTFNNHHLMEKCEMCFTSR